MVGISLSFVLSLISLMNPAKPFEIYMFYMTIWIIIFFIAGILGLYKSLRYIGPMMEEKRRNYYESRGMGDLYNGSK